MIVKKAFDRRSYLQFHEESSKKYPEGEIVAVSSVGRLRLKRLLNYVNDFSKPGVLLLDAGCSDGLLIFSHYKKENRRVNGIRTVGVDIGSQHMKRAYKTAKNMKLDMKTNFLMGDLENKPFKNNSCDIIVCSEVIEHLLEPERAIIEFGRILKGGGS